MVFKLFEGAFKVSLVLAAFCLVTLFSLNPPEQLGITQLEEQITYVGINNLYLITGIIVAVAITSIVDTYKDQKPDKKRFLDMLVLFVVVLVAGIVITLVNLIIGEKFSRLFVTVYGSNSAGLSRWTLIKAAEVVAGIAVVWFVSGSIMQKTDDIQA